MTGSGLLPLVRRWWWFILAGAIAAALLGWVVASKERKTYEAEVQLLVGPVSADLPTVQASGALGRTYAELAHSRPVVVAAARKADLKLSSKQIENAVSATSNDVTRIVDVKARYPSPEGAARLASGVASQLRKLKAKPPAESGDSVDAIMRDPGVASLPPAAQRAVRAAVVGVVGSPNVGNLTVVAAAVPPRDPVSPKVTLIMVLAALVGALLTSAYALIRESAHSSREPEPVEDFEVASLFRNANGAPEEIGESESEERLRGWERS